MSLIKMIMVLMVLVSTSISAEGISFWDGTFAYKRLNFEKVNRNHSFVRMKLSGATLDLASQIEGVSMRWSQRDELNLVIAKEDCIISEDQSSFECEVNKSVFGQLAWQINGSVTKKYEGRFHNLKVVANKSEVDLQFEVLNDGDFTPVNQTIKIQFPVMVVQDI